MAIHLLMPVVGLKNLIVTGSALDLAVSVNFADYEVYSPSDYDMMIVAGKRAQDWTIDPAIFKQSGITADQKQVDIRVRQDFMLHRQGTKAILAVVVFDPDQSQL